MCICDQLNAFFILGNVFLKKIRTSVAYTVYSRHDFARSGSEIFFPIKTRTKFAKLIKWVKVTCEINNYCFLDSYFKCLKPDKFDEKKKEMFYSTSYVTIVLASDFNLT